MQKSSRTQRGWHHKIQGEIGLAANELITYDTPMKRGLIHGRMKLGIFERIFMRHRHEA
jgi:hypothetical protein